MDAAVCIAQAQPLHRGHVAVLQQALALAPRCVLVLRGAHQARTPKCPFTWREREAMARAALSPADQDRLRVVPLRERYDAAHLARDLQRGVAAALRDDGLAGPSIAVVSTAGDARSAELAERAGWALHAPSRSQPIDAEALRNAYFGAAAGEVDAALAALVEWLPGSTAGFLRAWSAQPTYAALAEEWRVLQRYRAAWSGAPFPPVFVTVDTVVTCAGHVLLIERGHAPGKGLLAVPGGFIETHETLLHSALRELREETGLTLSESALGGCLRDSAVFDHPDRSQRGRMITHAYHFELGNADLPVVAAGDDAAAARWVRIDTLAGLEERFHDDHFHMLGRFLDLGSAEPR